MWIPLIIGGAAIYAYTKTTPNGDAQASSDAIDALNATISNLKAQVEAAKISSSADSTKIDSLQQSINDLERQLDIALDLNSDDGITQDDVDYLENLLGEAETLRDVAISNLGTMTTSYTEAEDLRGVAVSELGTMTENYTEAEALRSVAVSELETMTTNYTEVEALRDEGLTIMYGDDMVDDGIGGWESELTELEMTNELLIASRDTFSDEVDDLNEFIYDYDLSMEYSMWTPR
tara:strand:- start:453 stop:1157 length:705 start_codon:yes stop_codon:yes gene_type:complete